MLTPMTEYDVQKMIDADRRKHSMGCFGVIMFLALGLFVNLAAAFTDSRLDRLEKHTGITITNRWDAFWHGFPKEEGDK